MTIRECLLRFKYVPRFSLLFFIFSNYQLNAQFLYSSTICMLHYDPHHVSSSTLLILRRTNCITTASDIVTLKIGERSYINKMRSAVLLNNIEIKTMWSKNVVINEVNPSVLVKCSNEKANVFSPLSTGILYGRLQRVPIPDSVIIQFCPLGRWAQYCSKQTEDYNVTYIYILL